LIWAPFRPGCFKLTLKNEYYNQSNIIAKLILLAIILFLPVFAGVTACVAVEQLIEEESQ